MIQRLIFVLLLAAFPILARSANGEEIPMQQTGWVDALVRGLGLGEFSLGDVAFGVVCAILALGGEWVLLRLRPLVTRLNPRRASKSLERVRFKTIPGHKMLILGEGGSGKSSLVSALSHGAAGRSDVKTSDTEFATFALELCVSTAAPNGTGMLISTADYNGQRPNTINNAIKGLTDSYKVPVTAIVLVVDVVAPPTHADDPVRTRKTNLDTDRIRKQCNAWGGNALDFMQGELGSIKPKLVLLFINAIDAVEKYAYVLERPLERNHENEIIAHFEVLREKLTQIWGGVKVQTVVGSLLSVHTVMEIKEALKSQAIAGGAG